MHQWEIKLRTYDSRVQCDTTMLLCSQLPISLSLYLIIQYGRIITFSSDFTWTAHYNIIISKAYQMLGLIRRTFKIDCVNAKKQLYIALVRSQFQYCSILWRPQLIKDITMIERIQRRATKYILNDYNSSYKSRLQQLNLLPLMYNFELQDLLFLIKSLKSPTDYL